MPKPSTLLLACLGISTGIACAATGRQPESPPEPRSADVGEGDALNLRAARAADISRLLKAAAATTSPLPSEHPIPEYRWHESKHLAILLLGDYRASEAVPVLMSNLRYRNPKALERSQLPTEAELFPAVEALSKIGMPAVPAVISRLGSATDEQERRNCVFVLKSVLGELLAQRAVELAIADANDEATKAQLTRALPALRTLKQQNDDLRKERDRTSAGVK